MAVGELITALSSYLAAIWIPTRGFGSRGTTFERFFLGGGMGLHLEVWSYIRCNIAWFTGVFGI